MFLWIRTDTPEGASLHSLRLCMSITTLFRTPRLLSVAALCATLLAVGCEQVKTSNPLSPLIAGPIAGVDISLPRGLEPGTGTKIEDKNQPVTLLIENPSSNSPRPFKLRLEVATDSGFTTVVFTQAGIEPGPNGQTRFVMPDRLAHGRTYYWRIRAEDGANSSAWSTAVAFEILTPIVIGTPTPRAPAGNVRQTSRQPTLVAGNGTSTGPHGALFYLFQLSTSQTFGALTANAEAPQGSSGETTYAIPTALPYDGQFYWRVRISDGQNTGEWSITESFRTPLAPVVVTPPSGPPASGGSCVASTGEAIVTCNRNRYSGSMSTDQIISFLTQSARDLNAAGIDGRPFGLLVKTSGHQCNGLSCDIVCSGNGSGQRQWDILSDADGAQRPVFSEITGPKVIRTCNIVQ